MDPHGGDSCTYEALEETVIKEHVMKTYRKELVIFLAERQYETLNQLAEAADRFEEAHSRVGPTEQNVLAHTGDRQRPNGKQGNHNWMKGNNDHDVPEVKKTSSGDNSEAPHKKLSVSIATNLAITQSVGNRPNR